MKVRVEKKIGASTLAFETGLLAKQANAAVLVTYGETVVISTATSGPPRPGIDFFPLMCDYRERMPAAGRFPGGFLKREGRPTMKETLTARLIDRPVRPLFPKGFHDEVQCQNFVLSSDRQNDGDVLAMNGSAAALHISDLPFAGPVASVRIGRIDGQLTPFPTQDQLEESDLDLIVSGSEDAVTMIEGFAREMPEDEMADAIMFAHEVIREICSLQRELYDKVQPEKKEYNPPEDDGLLGRIKEKYYDKYKAAKQTSGKQARGEACSQLKEQALAEFIPDPSADDAIDINRFKSVWHDMEGEVVRELILAGTRPDGRDGKTLRNIECHVDLLPRVHGSAIFQRGETQAFITVTLGTQRDEQRVDGLLEEYSKKFMLDYNFPPFSVGECRPIRGPGRREIGHGALAERSVKAVMPDPDDFPYTVRIISDIFESNGSSSMASVCGATLGLMAAGVPITNPVAGISVGLVKEGDDWTLLTDILGDEDHFGEEIIRETLTQSRQARIEILRNMLSTISRPRDNTSSNAPRLLRTTIDPDKIGALIGPGGKNIRHIQESTGTVIEVDDDGIVTVASENEEWAQAAMNLVEACTATVQVGKIYDGRVTSIKDFGAFVEILPGRDGLCHISELSNGYVSSVNDVCSEGDEMKVLVIGVDDHDRVKLSRRKALEELGIEDELAGKERPVGEGDRGGDRGDRGGRDRGGDRGRRREGGRRRSESR